VEEKVRLVISAPVFVYNCGDVGFAHMFSNQRYDKIRNKAKNPRLVEQRALAYSEIPTDSDRRRLKIHQSNSDDFADDRTLQRLYKMSV
jgi:hypothetical protein